MQIDLVILDSFIILMLWRAGCGNNYIMFFHNITNYSFKKLTIWQNYHYLSSDVMRCQGERQETI